MRVCANQGSIVGLHVDCIVSCHTGTTMIVVKLCRKYANRAFLSQDSCRTMNGHERAGPHPTTQPSHGIPPHGPAFLEFLDCSWCSSPVLPLQCNTESQRASVNRVGLTSTLNWFVCFVIRNERARARASHQPGGKGPKINRDE